MTLTADVVVVGAGVIGASIAFELCRAGMSVLVVDKASGPGQGSTSASSAVVRFNYSTWEGVAASWESKHAWDKWADHLGGVDEAGMAAFHRTGKVMLDVDIAPHALVTPLFDKAHIPYEVWDAEELLHRVPGIDNGAYWPPKSIEESAFWDEAPKYLGAVWTPDAGFIDDPSLSAVNLANAAKRHGAKFVFGRSVVKVLGNATSTTGVELSDGTTLSAPVVVNAAGPWSSKLNELAGVGGKDSDWSVTVHPMRQEVHHVPAPPGFSPEGGLGPVVADIDLGTYMRAAPGGGFIVGGTEPACDPFEWIDDPDKSNPNPTTAVYNAQVTRAARRFPELGVPGKPVGIAGVYDVTEDWTPVYDETERPGFFVAIGTSGNQFKNAPISGKIMTALIHQQSTLIGEHTGLEINLSAWSRNRPRNKHSTGTVMG